PETVARWLPRRRAHVLLLSSLFGFVAPVCDCGVVPLARRLAAKGVPGYAATAFILAAPVVNPVVLLATLVAFQGPVTIVVLRLGMTLSVALLVGALAARLLPGADGPVGVRAPIRGGAEPITPDGTAVGRPVDGNRPGHGLSGRTAIADVLALTRLATAELFDVMFFIVLGALFTAATQTFVPRGGLTALGASPIGSVAALMPGATLLAMSPAPAVSVARACARTFPVGSVLALMTIGQILGLRNGFLLYRTLDHRLVLLILLVAYGLIFAEGVLLKGTLS